MRAAWLVLLAVLLQNSASVSSQDRYIEDNDRFPGWKGELPVAGNEDNPGQPKALSQDRTGVTVGYGEDGVVSFDLTDRCVLTELHFLQDLKRREKSNTSLHRLEVRENCHRWS